MADEHLKKELETYEARKQELLGTAEGKYVVIQGDRVVGTWETYEDALQAGYTEFGVKTPFLVKQVSEIERIQFFTRSLAPPCQS